MIKNLTINEIDSRGCVRRNGFNLGQFILKNGIYHFVDSICNGSGTYYHSINTNCTTLEDAIKVISK